MWKWLLRQRKDFVKKLSSFLDSENESDDSDDKFEIQDLYDRESESDSLDFIFQNYILLIFK